MQSPLHFLAVGASLTAGYCNFGLSNHPYAIHLSKLFSSANIPIIVDQRGASGEHVVPTMVKRLESLLSEENTPPYDWVIILGGTNDLGYRKSAQTIFDQGLRVMYDMVLRHGNKKTKLAVMTVLETGYCPPEHVHDKQRQILNEMIRNYAHNCKDQDRICLIDLDKSIPYHSIQNIDQRKAIWDDSIHLTAAGYDQMVTIIFQEIYKNINEKS